MRPSPCAGAAVRLRGGDRSPKPDSGSAPAWLDHGPATAELVDRPHPVGLVDVAQQVHVHVLHEVVRHHDAVALDLVMGDPKAVHPVQWRPPQNGDGAVTLHAQRVGLAGVSRLAGGAGAGLHRYRVVAVIVVVVDGAVLGVTRRQAADAVQVIFGVGIPRLDADTVFPHALDGGRHRVAAAGGDQGQRRVAGQAGRTGIVGPQLAEDPVAGAEAALAVSLDIAPLAGDGLGTLRHASQRHLDAGDGEFRPVIHGRDGVGPLAPSHLRAGASVPHLQVRYRADVEGVRGAVCVFGGGRLARYPQKRLVCAHLPQIYFDLEKIGCRIGSII